MIRLSEFLKNRNFDFSLKSKIIRHKDSRINLEKMIRSDLRLFELYQAEQKNDVYNCDQIVSLVQKSYGLVFVGVYKVLGKEERCTKEIFELLTKYYYGGFANAGITTDGKLFYNLVKDNNYQSLENRLIIEWGSGDRAWHQWYTLERDKMVNEVLPIGYIADWPGYTNLLLDWHDLKSLYENQSANRSWVNNLSSVSGVYLITNNKTGELYIGSAYGENGIWGRWCSYAINGHGGNVLLADKISRNNVYHHDFTYSILQTASNNATKDEILQLEKIYKIKLGTRAFGLNLN